MLVDYSDWTYGSLIQIFFKSPDFFPFTLQQQLTTLDFLSYCGGSLGLFLGFSFLSAVEVFYYFFLRVLFVNKRGKIGPASNEAAGKSYFKEIFDESSIHGFKNCAEKESSKIERKVNC